MRILFDDLTFTLKRGERLALIGANGSGKTSLLRLIAGQDWPDEGEIKVSKDAQISYLPQNVDLPPDMTAIDAIVQSDSPVAAIVREYTKLLEEGERADRAVRFSRVLCCPTALVIKFAYTSTQQQWNLSSGSCRKLTQQ